MTVDELDQRRMARTSAASRGPSPGGAVGLAARSADVGDDRVALVEVAVDDLAWRAVGDADLDCDRLRHVAAQHPHRALIAARRSALPCAVRRRPRLLGARAPLAAAAARARAVAAARRRRALAEQLGRRLEAQRRVRHAQHVVLLGVHERDVRRHARLELRSGLSTSMTAS